MLGPVPASAACRAGSSANAVAGHLPPGLVWSMAAARMSGFNTMPAPPPAGVSSTLRCLSVCERRVSAPFPATSRRAPAPGRQAILAEMPRKHLRIKGQDAGTETHEPAPSPAGLAGFPSADGLRLRLPGPFLSSSCPSRPAAKRIDGHACGSSQIDMGNGRLGKRNHHRAFATGFRQFEDIAGTEIVRRPETVPYSACPAASCTTASPIKVCLEDTLHLPASSSGNRLHARI